MRRGTGGNLAYNKELRAVQAMPANTVCADCGAAQPDWASVNLGVLVRRCRLWRVWRGTCARLQIDPWRACCLGGQICIGCSGVHRSMGVHVSKVRAGD